MKYNRFFIAAALLGTVLSACQREKEELIPEQKEHQTWTLTVKATKGQDTRALVLDTDNNKLNAEWQTGEKVDVYFEDTYLGTLTAEEDGLSSALTGELNDNASSLTANESELTLIFPGRAQTTDDWTWTYIGQVGDLPASFDYSMATVMVTGKSDGTITVTEDDVVFVNQQSIYRFKFKEGDHLFKVNQFTVFSQNGKLVRSLSLGGTPTYGSITVNCLSSIAADDGYYVALRNEYGASANDTEPDDKYIFTFVDATTAALYEGTKPIPASKLYDKGKMVTKFMGATVTLTQKTIAAQDTEVTTAL